MLMRNRLPSGKTSQLNSAASTHIDKTFSLLCRGELLGLEWDCVNMNKTADENGLWGTLEIRRGLKRKERRRVLPITEDMAAVLSSLRALSKCQHVFT